MKHATYTFALPLLASILVAITLSGLGVQAVPAASADTTEVATLEPKSAGPLSFETDLVVRKIPSDTTNLSVIESRGLIKFFQRLFGIVTKIVAIVKDVLDFVRYIKSGQDGYKKRQYSGYGYVEGLLTDAVDASSTIKSNIDTIDPNADAAYLSDNLGNLHIDSENLMGTMYDAKDEISDSDAHQQMIGAIGECATLSNELYGASRVLAGYGGCYYGSGDSSHQSSC